MKQHQHAQNDAIREVVADELATIRALNASLLGPALSDAERATLSDARLIALAHLRDALDQLHPRIRREHPLKVARAVARIAEGGETE